MKVRLKDIRLEPLRDCGDVWLARGLWRMLGLDGLLAKLLVRGREDVSWGTMAAVRGVARFSQPSSERHSERKWYRRTALEDLLGVPPEELHTDRLHAAPDRLLPHQEALESHHKQRFGELFELRCDPLLYDVTGTCLAGDAENCEIAKRGYSRDSRGDDLQVCSGPVVTAGGIPLGHEVFAGNMHDSLTLKSVVESLERGHGGLNRVGVMDRGMVSDDELECLREHGVKSLVGVARAMLPQFERQLTDTTGRTQLLAAAMDGDGRGAAALERAMGASGAGMADRSGHAATRGLEGRDERPARGYRQPRRVADESHRRRSGQALEATYPADRSSHGRQDREGRDGDSARVAPEEGPLRSHVRICFLAYAMWKPLAGWMKDAGLGDAARTLIDEFARIESGDIVLPAESVGGIRATVRLPAA